MKITYIIGIFIVILAASGAVFYNIVQEASDDEEVATTTTQTQTSGNNSEPINIERSNEFTLEEVAQHSTPDDCWTTIEGKVYEITSFFGRHPGGDDRLSKACGIDASEIFATQGGEGAHSTFAVSQLAEFEIGSLAK